MNGWKLMSGLVDANIDSSLVATEVASETSIEGTQPSGRDRVTLRRVRDLLFVVVVVGAVLVSRMDTPRYRDLALKQAHEEVAYLDLTITVAWVTASIIAIIMAFVAVIAAGGAASLLHRILARLTRDEARHVGSGVSLVVLIGFVVRLVIAAFVPSVDAPLRVFAMFNADLGLVAVLGAALFVIRRTTALSWPKSFVVLGVVAAALAPFVTWGSLR